MRHVLGIIGIFIGAFTNVVYNLIASAIQQKQFTDQFTSFSIFLLVIMGLLGGIVGYAIDNSGRKKQINPLTGIGVKRNFAKNLTIKSNNDSSSIDVEDNDLDGDITIEKT